MSRKQELVKNTIIISIGKLSTQVVSFFLLPLYTSRLSTAEYGNYDIIVTMAVFIVPIITLLMEESMFRFLLDAKEEESQDKIITQTFIYISVSMIISLAIIALISYILNISVGWYLILYIFSTIALTLANSLSRGYGAIALYSISNLASGVANIILNLIFILVFNMGFEALLYAALLSNLITSLIVFLKMKLFKHVKVKEFNVSLLKKMIKYSYPLVPNSISWAVINLSDRLILTNFLGASANGIYSIAYKFPNIMNTFYGFFYTAWKETSARIIGDETPNDAYNSIYSDLQKMLYSIVLGIIAILPFIFNLIVKGAYVEGYFYIPILLISMYFNNISGYYGGIFSANMDTKIMGRTTIVGAIINIVVCIAMISFAGIYAAAVSTLVSTLVVAYLRKKELNRYVKLNENISLLGIIVLAVTLFFYYNKNTLINLIVVVIVILYCVYLNKKILKYFLNKGLLGLRRKNK